MAVLRLIILFFRKDILWFICDVELKKGDLVRTGITNLLFGFKGGCVQFDTYVNSGYVGTFSNERMLPQ